MCARSDGMVVSGSVLLVELSSLSQLLSLQAPSPSYRIEAVRTRRGRKRLLSRLYSEVFSREVSQLTFDSTILAHSGAQKMRSTSSIRHADSTLCFRTLLFRRRNSFCCLIDAGVHGEVARQTSVRFVLRQEGPAERVLGCRSACSGQNTFEVRSATGYN